MSKETPATNVPEEAEKIQETEAEIQNKRKRAAAEIDFGKLEREEDDEEEPPKKRKYGDPKLEQHLNLLQASEILVRLKIAFPEVYVRVMGDKEPWDANEEEANKAIASIKFIQGCKSTNKVNEWLGSIGVAAIEDLLINFTPIKANGLSLCSADEDFKELWKEMTIDMMSMVYIDPKYRMAAYLMKNCYLLHHVNERREIIAAAKKAESEKEKEPSIVEEN